MSSKRNQSRDKLLFSAKEAAELLAISPRKLWDLTARQLIPHIRIGRCVRYAIADLERWIDTQKEGGDA